MFSKRTYPPAEIAGFLFPRKQGGSRAHPSLKPDPTRHSHMGGTTRRTHAHRLDRRSRCVHLPLQRSPRSDALENGRRTPVGNGPDAFLGRGRQRTHRVPFGSREQRDALGARSTHGAQRSTHNNAHAVRSASRLLSCAQHPRTYGMHTSAYPRAVACLVCWDAIRRNRISRRDRWSELGHHLLRHAHGSSCVRTHGGNSRRSTREETHLHGCRSSASERDLPHPVDRPRRSPASNPLPRPPRTPRAGATHHRAQHDPRPHLNRAGFLILILTKGCDTLSSFTNTKHGLIV